MNRTLKSNWAPLADDVIAPGGRGDPREQKNEVEGRREDHPDGDQPPEVVGLTARIAPTPPSTSSHGSLTPPP